MVPCDRTEEGLGGGGRGGGGVIEKGPFRARFRSSGKIRLILFPSFRRA